MNKVLAGVTGIYISMLCFGGLLGMVGGTVSIVLALALLFPVGIINGFVTTFIYKWLTTKPINR